MAATAWTLTRPGSGTVTLAATTTAIQSIEAGPLFLELWVEEGTAKDALIQEAQRRRVAAT